jgi:two-component system chemotaxis response regulator CheY
VQHVPDTAKRHAPLLLVVDDNELQRRLVTTFACRMGLATLEARDADEARAVLRAHPRVDLVMMDVCMPGEDGLHLLGTLRDDPAWRFVPVILCTAMADRETVLRARDLGVSGLLVKPVTREALRRVVEEGLRRSPPRLAPRAEILQRSGMTDRQYGEMLPRFGAQAQRLLGAARWTTLDLHALAESATLIGALRVAGIARACAAATPTTELAPAPGLVAELERLLVLLELPVRGSAAEGAPDDETGASGRP